MIDLSQAYDRININTLCTKLKRTELPEQISNIIDYMCRNTFFNINFVNEGISSRVFNYIGKL